MRISDWSSDVCSSDLVGELAERCRAAGAALVEDDDAIMARVEEAAVVGAGPGTRAAVQEHDRAPFRIAGNFPVHGVAAVQVEPPLAERLDGRKQVLCKPRTGWIQIGRAHV